MKDNLGDRIKENYESRTRYMLPRRTYTLLRLDGKAFHTYTRSLKKPFDRHLFDDIDAAIIAILPEIQGAVFAYTQSDEISILVTDFANPTTSAWFDGNLQKITSVSSSLMTAEFNKYRWMRSISLGVLYPLLDYKPFFNPTAYFDCRVFTIPDRTEVMNYFIWRNQDCIRNSVSMVAQSKFSHNELQGKSTTEMVEMLSKINVDLVRDYTAGERNGRLIVKETYLTPAAVNNPQILLADPNAERTRWISKNSWKFTDDKDKLLNMIPKYA